MAPNRGARHDGGMRRRSLALCCVVLALGGADARRAGGRGLRQSDESGETESNPAQTTDAASASPAASSPPVINYAAINYPPHLVIPGTTLNVRMLDNYPEAVCNDGSPGCDLHLCGLARPRMG